ncbi:radical SAM protein [Hymenobacter rubripertinctus]|uniref:Radical SAM protein n=1 Tax=Hymenobacter rubripertinctus TaxID=2029981 RepID=A0A418QXA9_9BACT|nr:radical SAM protein [Hymenobacter rubripertinctus]RIY09798.1 radical SAM protein [Hymenobacter rubripertinctus]
MKTDFTHCESIYWVFTQVCNDKCDHCYNSSGPQGTRISVQDCFRIIDNLPEKVDRLILSGGEPLADKVKLYSILEALQRKYQGRTQIMLQTNGDLLTEKILDLLIEKGVTRFDIASIDRYHKAAGARLMTLADLFESRGVNGDDHDPLIDKEHLTTIEEHRLSWGYWGASEDMWLGGNWARGRALEKDIWLKDPSHNFCAILSGAKGFLGGTELPQEISIQLWKINPCCPGTKFPLGDARKEKVADVLLRASKSEIMQRLNEGAPWKMGESIGVSETHALARTEDLQNVCKWCDEFFEQHFEGPLVASEEPKVAV